MTFLQICVLFVAAILGGALNSVAGGGSFITFPTLLFTGVPPINANATSTVALWPGSVASTGAYRQELAIQERVRILVLSGTSLVGGVLGAILLLRTSQTTFVRLVPYLLLLATVLFAVSGPITNRLRRRNIQQGAEPLNQEWRQKGPVEQEIETTTDSTFSDTAVETKKPGTSWFGLAGIAFLQLIIAIYGGYFGGGIGILMLATLGFMGIENIHEMNALKTLLTSFINGVAVITFIIAGAVVWLPAILMVAGAIIGGYGGAYFARQIDPRWVRYFVILVGVGLTIYFFLRG
jgi:uncharacterized membrane protein YfcA